MKPILKNNFYKLQLLKSGITLLIDITWKCNFRCSYCPSQSNKASRRELSFDQWLEYIETFPLKIRQISISGGEPTLRKGVDGFINELINRGYFVKLYTNLSRPLVVNAIKKSSHFQVITNYHSEYMSPNVFIRNLGIINKHQVVVGEFKNKSNISPKFRSIKMTITDEELKVIAKNSLRVSPEGTLGRNCYDVAVGNYK